MGDAFLAQPKDVMDSVQRLRTQAEKAGNLKSNEQVKVTIEPTLPPEPGARRRRRRRRRRRSSSSRRSRRSSTSPLTTRRSFMAPWPYPAYPPYYYPTPPGIGLAHGRDRHRLGHRHRRVDALWGGCNWGRGDVNVNVNRYNNINTNDRSTPTAAGPTGITIRSIARRTIARQRDRQNLDNKTSPAIASSTAARTRAATRAASVRRRRCRAGASSRPADRRATAPRHGS